MIAFLPLLLGSLIGLGKGLLIDKPKEERDKKMAATIARYSPWTGMSPGKIRRADPFGSALQGGVTGFLMGGGKKKLSSLLSGESKKGVLSDLSGAAQSAGGNEAVSFAKKIASGEPLSGEERMLVDSLSDEEKEFLAELGSQQQQSKSNWMGV